MSDNTQKRHTTPHIEGRDQGKNWKKRSSFYTSAQRREIINTVVTERLNVDGVSQLTNMLYDLLIHTHPDLKDLRDKWGPGPLLGGRPNRHRLYELYEADPDNPYNHPSGPPPRKGNGVDKV